MARTCSECTYLNLESEYDYDGRFWCENKGEWRFANSAECWDFCQAYGRASSVARSYYKYSEDKQRDTGGCFITTVVCEILGASDTHPYLNTLREFRDQVLSKNETYKELLVQYDVLGPLIADKIRNDGNKELVAKSLLVTGIIPTVKLIQAGNTLGAIKVYSEMTNALVDGYLLRENAPTMLEVEQADITKSGHGYYVKQDTKRILR